ncbi:response regulator [Thermostilla marina]
MTTILVVDDSPVDRKLVGGLLEKRFAWKIEYAASGIEALARMGMVNPDLVITDLTMPEMDGLGLVRELQRLYPEVPVILMTAYGSDALAVEALELGAASYVPKSQLAVRLPETADSVLRIAEQTRSRERLMQSLKQMEFEFVLENDPELIEPLVSFVQQILSGMRFADFAGRLQMGIALKEALLNALFHGNLQIGKEEIEAVSDHLLAEDDLSLVEKRSSESPYSERRIHVRVTAGGDETVFVVRDDGPGFDVSALTREPSDEKSLGQGRGISLMRTFMDEVRFNDKGNEVTLVKRRKSVDDV